jgi:hypothetical protein
MRKSKCNKTLSDVRPTFTLFRNRCPICLKLHKKSKSFTTLYGLQYHLTDHQKNDDESNSHISINEIQLVIPHIAKAIEWGMLS